jgi:iron complex transport system substrate-binding protein
MTMHRLKLIHVVTVVLVLVLPAAGTVQAQSAQEACIETYQPGVDYFPDKVAPTYAENFSVTYHDSYKVVTVGEPYVGGAPQTYVLVQCGAPTPDLTGDLAGAAVIQIPVMSVFAGSTTHNPMFDALDAVDRITGVATLAYTTNEAILAADAAGRLTQFAVTGAIDAETVIDAEPDVLFTDGGDDSAYDVLRRAGIPVVAVAEWLEPNLLGRAEWIKYFSLFLDREQLANSVFASVEASYQDAAATVADIPDSDRPIVLAGSSFQGIFYAPGGRSYTAQAIEDAGGRYVFADDPGTASLTLPDLEIVLDAAGDADIWINSATSYRTLDDIVADEPRLAALPAAQSGQVWNYDLIRTDSGGVGFFELGVLRPDLIVRDLIEIFHPGTLDDHQFVFYRPIRLE